MANNLCAFYKAASRALIRTCYEHGDTVQIYNDIISDMETTKDLLDKTGTWDDYYVVDSTCEFEFVVELEAIHDCDIVENGGYGTFELVKGVDVYVINGEHYVKTSDFQKHFPIY